MLSPIRECPNLAFEEAADDKKLSIEDETEEPVTNKDFPALKDTGNTDAEKPESEGRSNNPHASPSTSATKAQNKGGLSSDEKGQSYDNDSFKFEIGEVAVESLAREGSKPGMNIAGIKSKIPGLVALKLPVSPEFPANLSIESWRGDKESLNGGDDSSSGPPSPETLPVIKNILLPSFGRTRTRLLDPPPLTPAVKNQLARCTSTLGGHQRVHSGFRLPEENRASKSSTPVCEKVTEEDPPPPLQENGIKPQGLTSNLQHTPLSGSRIFSNGVQNFDEEQDPPDDNSIPAHKKRKKESKWFIFSQCLILLLLVLLLACSLNIQSLRSVHFLGLNMWQWQALTLVTFCGRLISGWVVQLLVVVVEKHYLLKKRVLYFVYGLRHSVENCMWLALVLGVWEVIFHEQEATAVVGVVTKILWCLFTASVSWMLKILAVKVAANSFHRTAYFDRIQDCLFSQHLLETLSGPPTRAGIVECASDKMASPWRTNIKNESVKRGVIIKESSSFEPAKELAVEQAYESASLIGKTHSNEDASDNSRKYAKNSPETQQSTFISPRHFSKAPWSGVHVSNKLKNYDTREGPKHTTVEVDGLTPSNIQTPQKRNSSVASTVPLIARSPIPIEQDRLQELTSDSVSAWTLKRLMKVIRNTKMTTYSSILSQQNGDAEINSEDQAKIAARKEEIKRRPQNVAANYDYLKHLLPFIFYNMARPGQKFLMFKDFLYFLPEDKTARAFSLFEVTEAGTITKSSLMKWVVGVYKERRALALTLDDNKTVVAKLHKVVNAVLSITLFIVFLLIFGVETSKLLVFFSSIFIPSVFIFGNVARTTFESLIFLFIMHPYDVGDRIAVDGQVMLVEEMNILNTILLNSANEKIYFPNALLATKAVSNIHRSPDQGEALDFQINMSTPVEKLAILKERIQQHIESLPQFWYPDFRIVCKEIEDCNRMKMAIWLRHRLNFQDGGERFQRRSNLLLFLKQQFDDLAISYQLPRQEIKVTGIPVLDLPFTRQLP